MLRVGLTGGIGAGKSAVARRLAERGAVIIDADLLSREVVQPGTEGLAEIVAAFGPGVLTPDGELDRPALGAEVFGDEEARRRLERIIHPRVRQRTVELTRAAGADAVVVNDVPLLAEVGLAPTYHLVIVVTADRDVRLERLTSLRGMTAAEAAARIDAQTDDDHRRAVADVVLENDTGLDRLHARVDLVWRERLVEFERNLRLRRSAPRHPGPRVLPSDPEWPRAAARLVARLRHGLGDDVGIHHIGSTAVPGLAAQDVIDLMIGVRTLHEADALAGTLADLGFPERAGDWSDHAFGISGRTWPKRMHGCADPGYRVDLHVRVTGSPGWRFALLTRDHLRAVPEARDAYAAAKLSHVRGSRDRLEQEARAADDWAEATGWQPGAD
ncbi:dephospho-CoA kinase [Actinoplanes capillaceus]|uniref:Dephospho-CoA kinase n=1 Tax=Actinoplanes campanulatus TaxID=113559 RepID=A0ABQ3WIJ0_9ACTN|nr:dephospho-CoA kinase [Actinoplanes capillaceus]GID46043.1 dephospho-CoA kinase [Actinoplanes capillaceus]